MSDPILTPTDVERQPTGPEHVLARRALERPRAIASFVVVVVDEGETFSVIVGSATSEPLETSALDYVRIMAKSAIDESVARAEPHGAFQP